MNDNIKSAPGEMPAYGRDGLGSVWPIREPIRNDPIDRLTALARENGWLHSAAEVARSQLGAAVYGIQLGEYDRLILSWIEDTTDTSVIAVIASLIERGRWLGT